MAICSEIAFFGFTGWGRSREVCIFALALLLFVALKYGMGSADSSVFASLALNSRVENRAGEGMSFHRVGVQPYPQNGAHGVVLPLTRRGGRDREGVVWISVFNWFGGMGHRLAFSNILNPFVMHSRVLFLFFLFFIFFLLGVSRMALLGGNTNCLGIWMGVMGIGRDELVRFSSVIVSLPTAWFRYNVTL